MSRAVLLLQSGPPYPQAAHSLLVSFPVSLNLLQHLPQPCFGARLSRYCPLPSLHHHCSPFPFTSVPTALPTQPLQEPRNPCLQRSVTPWTLSRTPRVAPTIPLLLPRSSQGSVPASSQLTLHIVPWGRLLQLPLCARHPVPSSSPAYLPHPRPIVSWTSLMSFDDQSILFSALLSLMSSSL